MVAGIGGLALFVFLFFDWFGGGVEVSGSVLTGSAKVEEAGISGWNALSDLPGFLIMLSGVAGLALAYLAATGQRVNAPVQRGTVTFLLGTLAVLLILWRMVAGTPSLKIGVFLGLGAAIAITVGALMALREDGYEPLVSVPGGRTKAASASPTSAHVVAGGGGTPSTPPPAAVPARSAGSSSGGSTTTRRAPARKAPAKRTASASKSKSSSAKSRSGGAKRSSTSKSRSTKK